MKSAILLFLGFIWLNACSFVSFQRGPSNIFDRDDRIPVLKKDYPEVGILMNDLELKSSWGTAFHLSSCYIASAYHVIKDLNEVMSKEDFSYFISSVRERPIKAYAVAWGTPYKGELYDNDWVLLKLEECIGDDELRPFSLISGPLSTRVRGSKIKLIGFPEDRSLDRLSLDEDCRIGREFLDVGEGMNHNCATRPGNSGGPLYYHDSKNQKVVVAIAVASRGYFTEIIRGYSPFLANKATPIGPLRDAFNKIISIDK